MTSPTGPLARSTPRRISETAVLRGRLSAVVAVAQGDPVRTVPELLHVPAVRDDVVNISRDDELAFAEAHVAETVRQPTAATPRTVNRCSVTFAEFGEKGFSRDGPPPVVQPMPLPRLVRAFRLELLVLRATASCGEFIASGLQARALGI